jgi:hypothetical protein
MSRGIKIFTNYILDTILLLSLMVTVLSSYVVWFVLPHGIGLHGGNSHCSGSGVGSSGNSQMFLGWCRNDWIEAHIWAAVVLAAIIITHILLHWGWIFATSKRITSHLQRPPGKVLELYSAALALLILFLFNGLSGLVILLVLPRGARDYNYMISGIGRTCLGLQRNVWVDLHAWVAVTIVSIIIIHLVLNWSWVVTVSRKIFLRSITPVP